MTMAKLTKEKVSQRTCVVTVTYYPNTSDIRFYLALQLCKLAAHHKIHLIIVDGSPDHAAIRDQFQDGSDGHVHVFEQDVEHYSGKGGSLRQAIGKATEWFRENNVPVNDAAICFTEPEKVDLINHVRDIVEPILDGRAHVIVPTRNDDLFRETYPMEQYHSESFGNMHFNLLARQVEGFQNQQGAEKLDWLFGPFAFNAKLASGWLNYKGISWDAQMVPYVRGVRNHDWRIMSVTVGFRHPKEMKEQEEGDPVWTTKRLTQLNLLFDLLGKKELSSR
mmetsp:Transcript_26000/g.55896  ORF Transcript_26000/g.55896 Transcript_26000/m.55896 type:complete len:278 (-) Transcript_26000:113-946(-)